MLSLMLHHATSNDIALHSGPSYPHASRCFGNPPPSRNRTHEQDTSSGAGLVRGLPFFSPARLLPLMSPPDLRWLWLWLARTAGRRSPADPEAERAPVPCQRERQLTSQGKRLRAFRSGTSAVFSERGIEQEYTGGQLIFQGLQSVLSVRSEPRP